MAAYAALLSLFHTLNHIKIHPRPPISLHQSQVESLTQNLTFFQHFLECYPTQEDDDLEARIAAAAYEAEDVIETHIVDQIHHATSTNGHAKNIKPVDLYGDLERVIQNMDLVKGEVMEVKIMTPQHHHHHRDTDSVGPASTWQSSTKPVFDEARVNEVLDKLTGQQSGLQIIPVVGMGGIGKTTFARNIYSHPLIVQHFDVLAWVTISQEYNRANVLKLLCQQIKGSVNDMSEDEMGLILYQHLYGRRYLIVMDDVWSVEAWDQVKSFFPDNNGSRVMITTRLSNLAFKLSGCYVFQMQFLDEDKSWDLLCKIVFCEVNCPVELENIGKEIARKCRGLPLSIAVIGGLLKKSNRLEYWLYTLENLNLLINLDKDEYTLRLLGTSYKELPMHLKPCFLYLGIFPEDKELETSTLVKLWVVEGILRPIDGKSLEEVAKEYLKELIDRNLVLIPELHWDGEPRLCKMHDLLRDVCLRESEKQKFFSLLREQKHHTPEGIDMERRICIDRANATEEYSPGFLHSVESASLARSFLYTMHNYWKKDTPSLSFKLLRVYSSVDGYNSFYTDINEAIFKQVNLRHLFLKLNFKNAVLRLVSLCPLLWNLQTLEVEIDDQYLCYPVIAIWEMPLLRHVITVPGFEVPDGENGVVLENLLTLSGVIDLKLSEQVVKRIPNIKTLKVEYQMLAPNNEEQRLSKFGLNNIGRLQKLEYLDLRVASYPVAYRSKPGFPKSLVKLSLFGTMLDWDEITTRIGSLPLLEVLILDWNACDGPKWVTIEGKFCSLKFLEIRHMLHELTIWETDSTHFPRLEHLHIRSLKKLEIPSCLGDITTLKSIRLEYCYTPTAESAIRIKEEQEEYGNEELRVEIVGTWIPEDPRMLNLKLRTKPESAHSTGQKYAKPCLY